MKKFAAILFALVCLNLSAATAIAQTPTSVIEGQIVDPAGAPVNGATVTVTEKATTRAFTVTTNEEGFYAVRSLQPGTYSIKVEQSGFATSNIENVVVQVGQVARADVSLKVGQQTETVQVDIGSTDIQVDTSRQTVDGVISGRQITALPLNQRNFLDLATLQPGVTVVDGGVIDPTKVNAFRAVRVNGGSGTGTRVQIEGIDVTDETVGTTVANFSTDAVQEFQLSRSSFDLSTSLTTSGAVSVASRTGGNQFTGSGFYFKQDDKFDARPLFEGEKPEFNRDQTGYRFGGRIIKDKLFFFSNFERFNQQDFSAFTSGDFSQFNSSSTLPIVTRYALNRLDWVVNDKAKLFYLHNFNDDSSTGGTIRSPFQNVDWTNTHVAGLNIAGERLTHSLRFGYVNFNNRIQSTELSGFEFQRTPQGVPYQLNVGDISIGPNGLAPQQTYQDNWQSKYDGSAVIGNHVVRYGGEVNRIKLGGFANFAGPLTLIGEFPSGTLTNPLDYPLQEFTTGPNSGFFTARPAHGLPFGGKLNTRYAAYIGDQWKIKQNLTLNFGVRYNYETNFFSSTEAPRIASLDQFGAGVGDAAKFPKNAFSPQIGFAWDPFKNGKTSIRGGFYIAYEANIFNNSLFDEFARIRTGIGPTILFSSDIVGPDGTPINVQGIPGCDPSQTAAGNYGCLIGRPIRSVLPFVGQIHNAVQAAYSNISNYNPNASPSEFENTNGVTFGGQIPGNYEIPYSMQFNIGFQHELLKGHVLSVDFVRQRAVGLPLLLADYEGRRDVRFGFRPDIAQSNVTNFLNTQCDGRTINQALTLGCPDPNHAGQFFIPTIANFGIAGDGVWTGRSSLTRARLLVGGFSVYRGLQVSLNGRFGEGNFNFLQIGDRSLLKGMTYTVGYAFGRNTGTSGSNRPEFIFNTTDNINYNDDYGPTALDRKHNLTVSASMDLIGGFRLDQIYRFATSPPISLFVPNTFGASGIYTSDVNGDGGFGSTPRVDLLPGTNIGDFGRRIGSIAELNSVLANYNSQFAGRLTPHGQRLVAAGIFTEAQMRGLKAVFPVIPLVPENNPNPFQNRFSADYRISRPIRLWKESWVLEPSFSIFNVFNNAPREIYAGLGLIDPSTGTVTNFGTLNYNYDTEDERARLDELRGLPDRINRRQLQFGIRFTF